MWGRKQRTIEALRRRVEELEERICPCGDHDWKRCDTVFVFIGTVDGLHMYKCKKCGKQRWDFI